MKNKQSLFYLVMMMLVMVGITICPSGKALAASAVTMKTVDYENENLVINNNGNTKIYFATDTDAAKENWEVIPADAGDTTIIDFSWCSDTVESSLRIKGDVVRTQASVTLTPKTQRLTISINYADVASLSKTDTIGTLLNVMTTAGTAEEPVVYDDLEWRKGASGNWKNVSELTLSQLEKLQIKGASLYFRIKPVNDVTKNGISPDGTKGNRASNEVKLKIAKKATAAVIGVDGSDFTTDIGYGKEYRVTINDVTTGWTKVTDKSMKHLPLSAVYNNSSDGITNPFEAALIEIRSYTTSKVAASKITEINLPAQRVITGTIKNDPVPDNVTSADSNVYIAYNGVKNMTITIPKASTQTPYEYCVVKPGTTFDVAKATWNTITKSTAVKVLASKAVEGGTLYVRMKEIKYKAATKNTDEVAYQLASTCVSALVKYPAIPIAEKQSLVFTKNYTDEITFEIKLNTVGKLPFETEILNIKIGSKEVPFTAQVTPTLPANPSENTEYVMKVTIAKANLQAMTVCSNKALVINYKNGTVDKNSIKITIQEPTKALALTVNVLPGSTVGTTNVKVITVPGTNNKFVYTLTDAEVTNKMTADKIEDGIAFTNEQDITIATGKYLTVYEINKDTNFIVKYRSVQITADKIKQ